MELKNLSLEELQEMSMVDIAHAILSESKKGTKIKTVFCKVASLLEMTEKEQENKIGAFYTAISTDKRFIILEDGKLDLKINHSVQKVKVEDDSDDAEDFIDIEEIDEDEIDEEDEDEYSAVSDDDDDVYDEDEDLKNLVIVDEEDMD